MRSRLAFLPVASGLLVLVLSLAVGVMTVTSRNAGPATTSQSLNTKASEATAKLGLSPANGDYDYSPGTTYTVGITLDSAGKVIDGADVVIKFNPAVAKVEETKVTTTPVFEQFPLNQVDNVAGQIRFSGLTFNQRAITGVIGTFRFRPLAKGEVNFTFDFTPGATTDSNIADHATAKDILGEVENGHYTFK